MSSARVDDRDVVERQIGRRPRAFRRVVARCPFGLPAVTEQEPYDDRRRPVSRRPTTSPAVTCRRRLPPRGGRRRRALERRRRREPRADSGSRRRRPPRSSGSAAALAAGRTGADDGASLDSGIGGSRNPAQLKCLHAHVAFALAQPGLPDRRAHSCGGRRTVAGRPLLLCARERRLVSSGLDSARRDWEDGYRRFELACRDRAQAERLRDQFDLVSAELRRRVGSTFTLAMLADAYARLGRLDAPGDRGARGDAGMGPIRLDGRAMPRSTCTRAALLTTRRDRAAPHSSRAAPSQPLAAARPRRSRSCSRSSRSGSRSVRP